MRFQWRQMGFADRSVATNWKGARNKERMLEVFIPLIASQQPKEEFMQATRLQSILFGVALNFKAAINVI